MQRQGNSQLRTPYGQYSNNLYQYTSGPMPMNDNQGGKPDFTPWFGAPLRDIKTNAYEGYAPRHKLFISSYIDSFIHLTGTPRKTTTCPKRTSARTPSCHA